MVAHLVDAAYALATATVFVFVATKLARRDVEPEARLAIAMFALWWYGVAFFLATGAATSLLDWSGAADPALRFTLAALGMLSVCAAVWGLVFYVAFVYSGRRGYFLPSLLFYATVYAFMVYAIAADPTEVERWHRSVVHLAILTGPFLSAVIVAFLLPAIVALVGYAGLYRRVKSPEQRLRVALTTTSLLLWFGLAIVVLVAGVADTPAWTIVGRSLALLAAAGVLVAHAPPAWVRQRLKPRPS